MKTRNQENYNNLMIQTSPSLENKKSLLMDSLDSHLNTIKSWNKDLKTETVNVPIAPLKKKKLIEKISNMRLFNIMKRNNIQFKTTKESVLKVENGLRPRNLNSDYSFKHVLNSSKQFSSRNLRQSNIKLNPFDSISKEESTAVDWRETKMTYNHIRTDYTQSNTEEDKKQSTRYRTIGQITSKFKQDIYNRIKTEAKEQQLHLHKLKEKMKKDKALLILKTKYNIDKEEPAILKPDNYNKKYFLYGKGLFMTEATHSEDVLRKADQISKFKANDTYKFRHILAGNLGMTVENADNEVVIKSIKMEDKYSCGPLPSKNFSMMNRRVMDILDNSISTKTNINKTFYKIKSKLKK